MENKENPVKKERTPTSEWVYEDNLLWNLETPPNFVYVAASANAQLLAAQASLMLAAVGLKPTSSWTMFDLSSISNEFESSKRYHLTREEWGRTDLFDVGRSDTMLVLAKEPSSSGGFHFELGYFLGSGKKNVVVVGARPSVFYYHPEIRWCLSLGIAIEFLANQARLASASSLRRSVEPLPESPFEF